MNKQNNLFSILLGFIFIFIFQFKVLAEEDSTVIVKKPLLSIRYFNIQNQPQHLVLQCNLKIDKKIEPIQNLKVKIYLDDETVESNLIESVTTNYMGKAVVFIPTKFKDQWNQSSIHKFIAVTDSINEIGIRQTETEITISRLKVDTLEDAEMRTLVVTFEELKEKQWVPVKDVEIKLGIQRLGSLLAIGEEPSVTTDSTGKASMEFAIDSLPGDQNGILTLAAKVEDHELYGNLESYTSANWGKKLNSVSHFNNRSLWATGDKIPIWLLSIACFVIFSVWGTLIYLVFRLFKTIKLGAIPKT